MIYERPSPPPSPRLERDPPEAPPETRTKSDARRHNTGRPLESRTKPDRAERVRIDRERALRREDRQRSRNDGDEGRSRTDAVDYHPPLERRLSYEGESYSPNELPPPSPPSQVSNREDYETSVPGHGDRNYSRGSERTRTPSPSRGLGHSHQSRGPRAYADGGDSRRLPVRPRSPNSNIGEWGYGKMSSRGSTLLDRLSTSNRTSERDAMEDRFDDRAVPRDVHMTPNGQDSAGERRDNGRRRRKTKGSRR